MGQAIGDYAKFLADARDALYRRSCDENTAADLAAQKKRQEKEMETEKKATADAIYQTVKKRLEEINSSYDKEIGKGQDKLKKARARREKAKSKGVKERIAEETAELREHNRDLGVQLRTLFQKEHIPAFCGTALYYTLYYPSGVKEFLGLLAALVLAFLALPCGLYYLIPQRQFWQLIVIYFADVLLLGGLYVLIGNHTRFRYQEVLKRGRALRNTLRENRKKIRVITRAIKRDGNEDIYDLEKYDDEIACAKQELEEIAARKKEAVSTFENVTKNIISDEIADSRRERLESLERALAETTASLQELENSIKEQNIRIADTFGPYLGKEYMEPDRLAELSRIIQSGRAGNITEAIRVYEEGEK